MKNRQGSDARWRYNIRKKAAELSMSTKAYRASRWPSAQWSYAIEVVRRRCKKSKVECTITPADLAELWQIQDGVCPLTGWKMTIRKSGNGLVPETVTVDRIKQDQGYTKQNIRLISFAANNARYVWSDADLVRLANAIIQHSDKPQNILD